MQNIITIFLFCFSFSCYVLASPFDVLNNEEAQEDRSSDINDSLDVNEGGEDDFLDDQMQYYNQPKFKQNIIDPYSESGSVCSKVSLIILNKVTAKPKVVNIEIGQKIKFGKINIKLERCWSNNNIYKPETKVFLEVSQKNLDQYDEIIFSGWLLSSNITASIFEHPTYSIFVKD